MNLLALPPSSAPKITMWLVDLEANRNHGLDPGSLSEAELARAARFRFERDALRFKLSHLALRTVLANHTGINARDLNFLEGQFGKPRLAGARMPHFNMSHSADWALIGVCPDVPIGIDIEIMHPMDDLHALARRNFSAEEFRDFQATAPHTQLDAFLSCWTRKEACLKALGSGLSIEPGVFQAGLVGDTLDTFIKVADERCDMRVAEVVLPIPAKAACASLHVDSVHLAM